MKDNSTNTTEKMTTEEFHRLLEENTELQNKLRAERQQKLADLHASYDVTLDAIMKKENTATDNLRKRREEFEAAKRTYELAMRSYAKARNSVGHEYNQGKAAIISEFATRNEQLQSDRHNIFERFRDSGGANRGRHGRAAAPKLEQTKKRVSDN